MCADTMRAAPGKRGRAGFREVAGARSQDVLLIRNTVGARMEIESGMLSENRLVSLVETTPGPGPKASQLFSAEIDDPCSAEKEITEKPPRPPPPPP